MEASYELTSILLGVVVFSGLVFVAWEQRHISLNIDRYPPRVKPVSELRMVLPVVSTTIVLFLLSVLLWQQAKILSASGEIFVVLGMPRALIVYLMSVMSGCAALVTIISYLARVAHRSRD